MTVQTTRIDARFAALKKEKRPALITFVTAGDPDLETSKAILGGLANAGADVIELGMPFWDPMADGPAIQASSQRALKAGQTIPLGQPAAPIAIREVAETARPAIASNGVRPVECMAGPNDDWLDEAAIDRFFSSDWIVQAKSNRTGMRLTGPEFTFSEKAKNKRPEHGRDPSNILDHGYPLGAINLAGQTPIILINDAPSTGGFINPFTVPSAAFWKLGQIRPNEAIRFIRVGLTQAQDLRRALDRRCTAANLVEL